MDAAKGAGKAIVDGAVKKELTDAIGEEAKKIADNLANTEKIVNAAKDTALQAGASTQDIVAYNLAKQVVAAGEKEKGDYASYLQTPQSSSEQQQQQRDPNAYKDINRQAAETEQKLSNYLREKLLAPNEESMSKVTSKSPNCKYDTSKTAKETFVQMYENQVNGARLPNLTDALSVTAWIRKAYNSNGVVGKVMVVLILLAVIGVLIISIFSFAGMSTEKKLATIACGSILFIVSIIFKMN